jgi:hypothetical protein
MTRGPQPLKAQDESLPIAEKRGLVMRYQHRRGNICDFSIMSPGLVSFVCAMRLIRLSSTPEDILYDFSSVIGQLRFIASSPAISRELWLRTPRGAWRFFRVLDDSILELGPDGMPLANTGTGLIKDASRANGAGPVTKPARHTGKKTRRGSRITNSKDPGPEKNPASDSSPKKDPGPKRDLIPATMPEKNSEKGKDAAAGNPVPDPVPANNPAPENNLKGSTIPETCSDPKKDPGPAADPVQAPEPEKIPGLIQKFLKRRKSGLEKDPGSE